MPGIPTEKNPRTGAYKKMIADGRDLHELHALMAPRPFPRLGRIGGSSGAMGGAEPHRRSQQGCWLRGSRGDDQPQGAHADGGVERADYLFFEYC